MNIYNLAILTSLVCGIYARVSPRGDKGISGNLVSGIPWKPLGPITRPNFCYDQQVREDQYFDDSFICTDKLNYPAKEINYALKMSQNRTYYNYMRMAGMFISENNYLMDHKEVAGSYSLDCVCKSNRKIITSVNLSGQRCHIVNPEEQKIYYADCSGPCSLAYGHVEGYFCVKRGFVKRTFLAYCEDNTEAFIQYTHGMQFKGHGVGGFYFMEQTLPTYCGCRGYFCK